MPFIVEKESGLIPQVLSSILDECVNGVTLADPDLEDAPLVYANKAFERLTGYPSRMKSSVTIADFFRAKKENNPDVIKFVRLWRSMRPLKSRCVIIEKTAPCLLIDFIKCVHSDKGFNVSTGFRFHIFDLLLELIYKSVFRCRYWCECLSGACHRSC